ncbi:MAG: hypothetical protein ACREN5_14385, partial [Gemmatimonadales bacterium]
RTASRQPLLTAYLPVHYTSPLKCLRVDRLLVAPYLAGSLAACSASRLPPVIPAGAVPSTLAAATAWVDSTGTREPVIHRFRWQFRDAIGSAGGPGSARITVGDSLRFDVAGPLGAGRGAAFVIGDTARWAQPEEEVRKLVPNYPLLWAMLGIVRLPATVEEVRRFADGRVTAWQFVSGLDTTEYAWIRDPEPRLIADVRHAGGRIGRVETRFDAEGRLRTSRLDVPSGPARLDIRYVSTERTDGFPPDTWTPPAP